MIKHCPVWRPAKEPDDGKRLIIAASNLFFDDPEEAWQYAWGFSLVEGVLVGLRFTGEVRAIDDQEPLPHVNAELRCGPVKATVWLIAGDELEVALKEAGQE